MPDNTYIVKPQAVGTPRATIRGKPHANARAVGRLERGNGWQGTVVQGQLIYVRGLGSSARWVCGGPRAYVWEGALDLVSHAD